MNAAPQERERVTQANRRYFDEIFDRYEADPRQRYGLFARNARRRYREFIEEHLPVIHEGIVVNIGCGTGNMLDIENSFGLRSVGFDISPNVLRLARRYSRRLFVGDLYCMPFPDGTVSFAVGLALLHHVYDHAAFFQELHRVLKAGGLFYADYDPNYWAVAQIKNHPVLGGLWRGYERYSDRARRLDSRIEAETFALADYYAVKEPGLKPDRLQEVIRGAGFDDVRVVTHSDGPSLKNPRLGRLPHKLLELLLWALGERDYARRAKNLAVIVRKTGRG